MLAEKRPVCNSVFWSMLFEPTAVPPLRLPLRCCALPSAWLHGGLGAKKKMLDSRLSAPQRRRFLVNT